MRVRSASWVVFLFALLLSLPSAVAQERAIKDDVGLSTEQGADLRGEPGQPSPPAPPLPWARPSLRGPISAGGQPALVTPLDAPALPGDGTAVLPLSAGLSVVSLPLRVPSETLSDIFPNLPEGSRVWTWNASDQKFVEGLDQQLPLGHACWLYVPAPVLLVVSGRPNQLRSVSVDLQKGWNLIGVPYGTALLRSQQQVYVDWARTPFNDAVAADELGSSVYTLDVNGYEAVDEDGSFEPLRGYWVYASGAELLELGRPGVSDLPAIPWGTVLSQVGSLLMTQMGYGDSAKLAETLAKLDNIAQTVTALNAKLDTVLHNIDVSKTEILKSIGDTTYVAPVQDALDTHYDEENPNTSLAWFVAQAKAGTGQSVPMTTRSDFARHVLNDWKFIDHFNLIKAGITPAAASDRGLLDTFADYVVLTSNQYDLKDRYTAMETYYSTLVGMQVKCATLIMNAYDQLANDPASTDGYTPQTAAAWKASVFDPTMKAETERFLQAVEGMAAKKIPVPQTWSDPPVKLPDSVQVVMGLADLYVMETLKNLYPALEPPGVRVRVMLNPGAAADLPTLAWLRYGVVELPHITTLPSFDTWQTHAGAQNYDDWILSQDSSSRAFTVTSNWKLVRVILPVTTPATVLMTALGRSAWWNTDDANSTVSATMTPSGAVFGSITLARRPRTRDLFEPCMGWPVTTGVTQNCCCWPSNSECDAVELVSCNQRRFYGVWIDLFGGNSSRMTVTYEFAYHGTVPMASTWSAQGAGTFTHAMKCDDPILYYELFKGKDPYTRLDLTVMDYHPWSRRTVQTAQVTWEPGQVYTFRVTMQTKATYCYYNWMYQGAHISFP